MEVVRDVGDVDGRLWVLEAHAALDGLVLFLANVLHERPQDGLHPLFEVVSILVLQGEDRVRGRSIWRLVA